MAYLLFTEIVGEIGHHDLILRWNTILRRATLAGLANSTRLFFISICGRCTFVGSLGQRQDLTWDIRVFHSVCWALKNCSGQYKCGEIVIGTGAYASATTTSTSTTSTPTSATTARVPTTALSTADTLTTTRGGGLLLGSGLRLAS